MVEAGLVMLAARRLQRIVRRRHGEGREGDRERALIVQLLERGRLEGAACGCVNVEAARELHVHAELRAERVMRRIEILARFRWREGIADVIEARACTDAHCTDGVYAVVGEQSGSGPAAAAARRQIAPFTRRTEVF